METTTKTHIGVDIAADWLDACALSEGRKTFKRFKNGQKGYAEFFCWLKAHGNLQDAMVIMEPTGRYGEAFAEYCYARRLPVVLVQPLQFRRYAESVDLRGKSDYKDAAALALYGLERGRSLREFIPKDEIAYELRDLQLLVRSSTKRIAAIKNQLKCKLRSSFVRQELEAELERLAVQKSETLKRASELVREDEQMQNDLELLDSIPGVAAQTALLMLILIDFRKFKSSRALACFLGLTKKKAESGKTVRGREGMSKRGSKYLRSQLYCPAMAAANANPHWREFVDRLKSSGKLDVQTKVAVARKLVTTAWAVINNQKPFDLNYVNANSLA